MPAVVRVAQPAVADEPLAAATPVCAYSHDNHLGTWRKSSAMSSCVWIQGGFGGKTESVAQTIRFEMGGSEYVFVHVHKNARWFIAAIAGPSARKGDIAQVKILDNVRRLIERPNADPNGEAPAVAEYVDPMEDLDDVSEVEEPKPKARRKADKPIGINLPKRPPCAGEDQGETVTIYAVLYRRKLHMRIDGLDWLLSYAADEYHFQNIVRQAEKHPPAVTDGFYIEWEFNKRSWVATVNVGFKAGKQFFNPDGISLHQWKKLQELSLAKGVLSRASFLTRKAAAKEIAKLWCAATHEGEGQSFEAEWLYAKPALYAFEPDPTRQRDVDLALDAALAEAMVEGVDIEG